MSGKELQLLWPYPLGTDTVDWCWWRAEEIRINRSFLFIVHFTCIQQYLALLVICFCLTFSY